MLESESSKEITSMLERIQSQQEEIERMKSSIKSVYCEGYTDGKKDKVLFGSEVDKSWNKSISKGILKC